MFRVSSSFDSRLARIEQRGRRLSKGASRYVMDDGLIVLMPHSRHRFFLVALSLVLLPVMAALGAKSFVLARLDAVALGEVVAQLEAMGQTGRALAWLLRPDAVTSVLSQALAGLLG